MEKLPGYELSKIPIDSWVPPQEPPNSKGHVPLSGVIHYVCFAKRVLGGGNIKCILQAKGLLLWEKHTQNARSDQRHKPLVRLYHMRGG